ncbi:hypothetical protein [Dasania marina]|uniref:hypothetical protein n=1 Tax=Dasania marina TaxID=471499 RepID=UPI00037DDEE3|nr:hypothetical protein [Dasania marina]
MFKRYFIALLVVIISVIFATAGFTWRVDPYGLYGEYTKEDSFKKPEVNNQIRLHKRAQLECNRYDALILGNSRAYRAYDPEHVFFNGYSTYNLALSGAHVDEIYSVLKYANRNSDVKKVLLVLDYSLQKDIDNSETKISSNIFRNANPDISQKLLFLRNTLLSVKSLKDSYKTLSYSASDGDRVTERGFYNEKINNYLEKDFRRLELDYLNKLVVAGVEAQVESEHDRFKYYYREVLAYLYKNDIDATIVVSPLHARFLQVLQAAGLWSNYEDWKKILVVENTEYAQKYNVAPYSVYDAAIYNAYNTEIISADKLSKWYFESSHARPEYGSALLDEIMEGKDSGLAVRLSVNSMDEHFEHQRAQRLRYLECCGGQVMHIKSERHGLDNK